MFGLDNYWENYYKENIDTYEWYLDYDYLKDYFMKYSKKEDNIIYLGCGTSNLGEKLLNDGFNHIENIDSCEYLINILNENNKNEKLQYKVMNANKLLYETGVYEAVIDKGLFDQSFLQNETPLTEINNFLREVYRVLTNTGIFYLLSYIDTREEYLLYEEFDWKVSKFPLKKSDNKSYYLYVCQKGIPKEEEIENKEEEELEKKEEEEVEKKEEEIEEKVDEKVEEKVKKEE